MPFSVDGFRTTRKASQTSDASCSAPRHNLRTLVMSRTAVRIHVSALLFHLDLQIFQRKYEAIPLGVGREPG